VGVQNSTATLFTQYECLSGGLTNGLEVIFTQPPCGTPTNTPTQGTPGTATPTPTCAPSLPGWITGPNHPAIPGIIRAVGVYFPPNGKFYTIGGRTSDSAGSDTTNPYEYTPGTPGSWVTKAAVFPDNQVNNMA